MGNLFYEVLVFVHEVVEWAMTQVLGIQEPEIKAFDDLFEAERARGLHPAEAEPGDDPRAPYRRQHQFATEIEKHLALGFNVDWDLYDAAVIASGDRAQVIPTPEDGR
jgi:hypothetical protein